MVVWRAVRAGSHTDPGKYRPLVLIVRCTAAPIPLAGSNIWTLCDVRHGMIGENTSRFTRIYMYDPRKPRGSEDGLYRYGRTSSLRLLTTGDEEEAVICTPLVMQHSALPCHMTPNNSYKIAGMES